MKLTQRGNLTYNAEQITDWLRNCYTEATALIDENGIIHGKQVTEAPQSWTEQAAELNRKMEGIHKLLDASKTIATLDPLQATENIISQTCRILDCDRASIFTVDSSSNMLTMFASEGIQDIRVPIGEGIAGSVALTGETINIIDAYSDPRFNNR